jgi:hypothetical protein
VDTGFYQSIIGKSRKKIVLGAFFTETAGLGGSLISFPWSSFFFNEEAPTKGRAFSRNRFVASSHSVPLGFFRPFEDPCTNLRQTPFHIPWIPARAPMHGSWPE